MLTRMAPAVLPPELHARVVDREHTIVVLTYSLRRCSALTSAELEVARLAVAGGSNRAIARLRGTSARTVANQIASAFRKLGVGSRSELAAIPEMFA